MPPFDDVNPRFWNLESRNDLNRNSLKCSHGVSWNMLQISVLILRISWDKLDFQNLRNTFEIWCSGALLHSAGVRTSVSSVFWGYLLGNFRLFMWSEEKFLSFTQKFGAMDRKHTQSIEKSYITNCKMCLAFKVEWKMIERCELTVKLC